MAKRSQTHRRRHVIAARDGWHCNFCRRLTECRTCKPTTDLPATTDHIIPRGKGGTDALTNLCIACKPCNEAKGDGIWPSVAERQRLTDPSRVKGWQQKRLAEPGVVLVECWPGGDRRRRPNKAYGSAEAAFNACASINERTGKNLTANQCRRCKMWHIGPPTPVTAEVA